MVFDVAQDTSGQLWFATRTGISRYTGISFINYGLNEGLRTYSYSYLVVDKTGGLWALPQSGELCVLKFSGNGWTTAFCDSALNLSPYYTAFDVFYQDQQLVLAAGSSKSGMFICSEGKWKHYTTADGLADNGINGIAGTGNRIYIATEQGLSIIQGGIISKENQIQSPFVNRRIMAVTAAAPASGKSDTAVWLLGENWLGYLSGGSFHLVTSEFNLPGTDIGRRCFLSVDANGDIYFGNPIYVYCYSETSGKLILFGRNSGLITNGGTSSLTDREGNLWITGYRGITKIPSKRFQQYSENDGLYNNEVASAMETSPGQYVFGHHGALSFYDGNRFTPFKLTNPSGKREFETRVLDIDMDAYGNLWMAVSANGIARLTKSRQLSWYNETNGLNGLTNSVLVSSDGNIYAGTNQGLFKFSNNRFKKLALKNNVDSSGIRKIFESPDHSLYLASYNSGVIRLSGDSVMMIKSKDNPLANSIFSVYFDNQHNSFVGTAAGLYTFTDSVLIKVEHERLVIDRPVYLILQDHQGCLWFGTDNGISRWKGEKLDQFTINDGISGLEINRDAGFQDAYQDIWFGTNNGLTKFNPEFDYDLTKIPPPKINLRFTEVDDDAMDPHENLDLPSSKNNLTFYFDIASYIDEQQVFYKCMLEGFDKEWTREIFSHSNLYRYNNLHPGTYRFCIKARNAIGIWSDPIYSGTIRIRNPFWMQWWFVLLAGLLVFGLFFILTRLVVIRRYNKRLAKMVAIRTRDLSRSEKDLQESNAAKDNFFSIIAHDLKSPFNAILGMLELLTTEYSDFSDDERQKILMNLRSASTRTIDLIENLLTWAQAQKGLLPYEPEKFDLLDLVQENVLLFDPAAQSKRITIKVPLSENAVVFGDRNMINTVIRNLISNAIKFTYPDGSVTLKIERTEKQKVKVSVADTGCGMTEGALKNLFILDKRTSTKGTGNETGTGLGLILSKEFITKNHGRIWVESEPGKGSTFYFVLPVSPPEKRSGK